MGNAKGASAVAAARAARARGVKKAKKVHRAARRAAKKAARKARNSPTKANKAAAKKAKAKAEVANIRVKAASVPGPIKEKAEKAYVKFQKGHLPKMSASVRAAAQKAYKRLHAKGIVESRLGDAHEDVKGAAYEAWKKYQSEKVPAGQAWPIVGDEDELGEDDSHADN